MTVTKHEERRIVPRWRPFSRSLADLSSLEALKTRDRDAGRYLVSKLDEWKKSPSIVSAGELVATATVLGRLDQAEDAIHFLREDPNAKFLLTTQPRQVIQLTNLTTNSQESFRKISELKVAVRTWPKSVANWVDLALEYSQVGLETQAEKCIRIALNLAPNNRFVLRAASRFFVHIDDPGQAAHILLRSTRTKHDPWLIAAQIAISEICGKRSPLVKLGQRVLQNQAFTKRAISELAASIGGVELHFGNDKKAKRAFEQSIQDPNDNVKAQLQWVALNHNSAAPSIHIDTHGSLDFEARSLEAKRNQDWHGAIENCEAWGQDESFSDRPFAFGSYLAIVALDNPELCEEFARNGLISNPTDSTLLNNLAVALALKGDCLQAEYYLQRSRNNRPDDETKLVTIATEGLINFRKGDIAKGRESYLQSIDLASKLSAAANRRLYLQPAILHFAYEELRAGTPDGTQIAELVLRRTEHLQEPEYGELRARLRLLLQGTTRAALNGQLTLNLPQLDETLD